MPREQDWNELGPEGARALAGALEQMTGMQTLNLVSGGHGEKLGWRLTLLEG